MKRFWLCLLGIDKNGFKNYRIRKNRHRSVFRIRTTNKTNFKLQVIFDETAYYKSKDPINQYDINKLWGISDCGEHHMNCSIRFGWRYVNENLELFWFKHEGGEFIFEKIKNIEINKPINLEIDIIDGFYVLTVDRVSKYTTRPCSGDYKRYKLYPYFGGDEKAPHSINIKIKEMDC